MWSLLVITITFSYVGSVESQKSKKMQRKYCCSGGIQVDASDLKSGGV